MPPLSMLIKPASSACNLRCRYCFYADEAQNRETYSYGMMSEETMRMVLSKAIDFAEGSLSIGFQGGEPTLRGLDFYRTFVEYAHKADTKGLKLSFALQTNGILLDDAWAQFLHDAGFLVGLSMDGTAAVHDRMRVDAEEKGTFERVLAAADLLKEHSVETNILAVVTSYVAKNIERIYAFYRKHDLLYQQYIPCLDPLDCPRGHADYSLTPRLYGRFLCTLFDLWQKDVAENRFIYIRHIENLLGVLRGNLPEHCGMRGRCAMQSIVEADGSVYPCDFYVLDRYRLGNLRDDDYETIVQNLQKCGFITESLTVSSECRTCQWGRVCRGGCRRDRDFTGELRLNYFCPAYKQYYAHVIPQMLSMR